MSLDKINGYDLIFFCCALDRYGVGEKDEKFYQIFGSMLIKYAKELDNDKVGLKEIFRFVNQCMPRH